MIDKGAILELFPPCPVLTPPSWREVEAMSPETLVELSEAWQEAIEKARLDPWRHGWVLPNWRDALRLLEDESTDHLTVLGGNRSSKSRFAAWLVMSALLKNPGTTIMAWSANEKYSIREQQSLIYEFLPPELRHKQAGSVAKISYKRGSGFTSQTLILPNGSALYFHYYTQFIQSPDMIEGYNLGWEGAHKLESAPYCNIGNWFDEYLGDPALLTTMEARLSTRNAKSLLTVTPVHQYTETMRTILEGAVTTEHSVAEIEEVEGESIPYVQRTMRGNGQVIYFHTRENPFTNYERFLRDLDGKSKAFIKMKAYGIPSKVGGVKFPKFSRMVNVLEDKEMDRLLKGTEGTPPINHSKYLINDPAGDKPWFLVWAAVDEDGTHYIYREWPSEAQWGVWAEWRDGKWAAGEAQTGECCGGGYQTYVDLIEAEEKEGADGEIYERLIDPRMGSMKMPGSEETTSIIAEMADRGLIFSPAPGLQEAEGIQAIQDLMDYNIHKPVDQLNRPKFYVAERCGNVILALGSYDTSPGKVDLKHPWKDPIDCLRYAAVSDLDYAPPVVEVPFGAQQQGGY